MKSCAKTYRICSNCWPKSRPGFSPPSVSTVKWEDCTSIHCSSGSAHARAWINTTTTVSNARKQRFIKNQFSVFSTQFLASKFPCKAVFYLQRPILQRGYQRKPLTFRSGVCVSKKPEISRELLVGGYAVVDESGNATGNGANGRALASTSQ